jgi:hypothetical protein
MDFEDEFDDHLQTFTSEHGTADILSASKEEGLLRPDLSDPVSSYLLLSDDAQDEIEGGKRFKCLSCGKVFTGIGESCPVCQSSSVIRDF